MYCCRSNSASRHSNCSGVKIVRTRLFFSALFLCESRREKERKGEREGKRLLHCAPVNSLRQLTGLELVALKAQRRLLCVMLVQLLQTLQGGGRATYSSSGSDGGGSCKILRSLM